jgi:hypothetical protein
MVKEHINSSVESITLGVNQKKESGNGMNQFNP